ncbi:hypothetical protein [Chthonobacter albigriseus]|uniref:hypothetical protein n=1 Tax=Chthonobacter albigriseus TaxID=1683161 RepID=UPI0015EECF8D|nr:hypothetical protein [Chthonobacter albigriseus]
MEANFFWHGPRLNLYTQACLTSFVARGVPVRLFTFNRSLAVPEGVTLADAGEFAREEEVLAYTQQGKVGSIAAFTDIFRYRLFQNRSGWWFDTDVYCLKGPEGFAALEAKSKGLLVGEQAKGQLNGAVLYMSDPALAAELERRAALKGFSFRWGEVGPRLITDFMGEQPSRVTVVESALFYPVHYIDVKDYFLPEMARACAESARDSLCIHFWNEFIGRWHIPQDILPCPGSYMHELVAATGVKVDPQASLPQKTFLSLYREGEIDRWDSMALSALDVVRRAKNAVFRRQYKF